MKIGDEIKIIRTPNGLYKVQSGDVAYIGGAASTAIHLILMVFDDEASEVLQIASVSGETAKSVIGRV